MRRAQQRDAVNQARFYFRREVFTPASSRATSGTVTPDITAFPRPCADASSTDGMGNGFYNDQSNGRRKQRVMENCFPPPPLPDEGLVSGSVKEEYGEYTMDEIINGRVSHLKRYLPQPISLILRALSFSRVFWLLIGRCVPGAHRPSRDLHWHARSARLGDVQNLELPGSRPASGKWLVENCGNLDPRVCSVPSFVQV
jgi:hypothetical protein